MKTNKTEFYLLPPSSCVIIFWTTGSLRVIIYIPPESLSRTLFYGLLKLFSELFDFRENGWISIVSVFHYRQREMRAMILSEVLYLSLIPPASLTSWFWTSPLSCLTVSVLNELSIIRPDLSVPGLGGKILSQLSVHLLTEQNTEHRCKRHIDSRTSSAPSSLFSRTNDPWTVLSPPEPAEELLQPPSETPHASSNTPTRSWRPQGHLQLEERQILLKNNFKDP